jgi:hypothetical protein
MFHGGNNINLWISDQFLTHHIQLCKIKKQTKKYKSLGANIIIDRFLVHPCHLVPSKVTFLSAVFSDKNHFIYLTIQKLQLLFIYVTIKRTKPAPVK